jgi:disulfide bond formation protein DsbB
VRDTDLAITFLTFLTLLANAATLGIAATAGAARLTGRPGARRAWARLHHEVAGSAVGLAWLVAAVAMSGSLWFSEVAGFTPCRLCWAQRAFMYPLVLVLAVAGLTRRPAWRVLALAMSTVGAAIAVYHVLVERFPALESSTCDPTNPCSLVWFERLGFVTLPYMALSGFALIGALLLTVGLRAPASTGADTGADINRDHDEVDDAGRARRAPGVRSTRPSPPPTPSDASPAIPVLEENLS